jgi:ubiquinone/menaquinone biosynthesis C-methylase UbiE
MSLISPGTHILELNAGTGDDAAFFVARGYRVFATDLAEGMINVIAQKAQAHQPHTFGYQHLSVTQLNDLPAPRYGYDLVFSNFGGLNCVDDLSVVTQQLSRLVRDGGYVVCVIMPPYCPWEWLQLLRGYTKTAFRRLHNPTTDHFSVMAHVDGHFFTTYYYTSAQVKRNFGADTVWSCISQQSLALFSPPSFIEHFPRRFKTLFNLLCQIDEKVGKLPALNGMGDYVMYTFQKNA